MKPRPYHNPENVMKPKKRKCAVIIAPVSGTDGKQWVCVCVNGNMQWRCSALCDSEEDAKQYAKKQRNHWRKFSDMQVCNRLTP